MSYQLYTVLSNCTVCIYKKQKNQRIFKSAAAHMIHNCHSKDNTLFYL